MSFLVSFRTPLGSRGERAFDSPAEALLFAGRRRREGDAVQIETRETRRPCRMPDPGFAAPRPELPPTGNTGA